MRRLLILIVATVLLLGISSCRKKNFEPSKFAGDLYSYQSLETVERKLDLKPDDWDVLENRKPLSTDTRPMFRIFTFSKKDFPLLNTPGQNLIMTFYNDRLMTVQFYPYNMSAFKSALAADGTTLSSDGDSDIPPSTRVWVGKDAQGKLYVGFMDKKLEAEHDAWMARYSQ
ncbi:MAG: hypothetical protein ROO76_05520 [Terriglobia bacterium]|nr:hypothetical protein [Terriglobia bacterium]